MTVSTTLAHQSFFGNGTSTVFPCQFKVFDAAHAEVYVDGVLQTLTTDYTVSGIGEDTTDITFVSAPATNTKVSIFRRFTFTQDTDYLENDEFPAETHERALDLLTMAAQQLQTDIARAIHAAEGDPASIDMRLPTAANRAGKLLTFDEDGQPVASAAKDFGVLSTGAQNIWEATQLSRVGAGVIGWEVEDSSQNEKVQIMHAANGGGRIRLFDAAVVERVDINAEEATILQLLTAGGSPRLLLSSGATVIVAKVDAGEDGISLQNLASATMAKFRISSAGHGTIEVRDASGNAGHIICGVGSPEGVRSNDRGTLYLRSDGGDGTTLYVKTSGTGNTGWRRVDTAAP